MVGFGEHVLEGVGTAVAGGFDGDLVSGPEREETAVLATDPLYVLDELVEIELLGLLLEAVEIDDYSVASVVGFHQALGNGSIPGAVGTIEVLGSSILRHRGKTKGNRCAA